MARAVSRFARRLLHAVVLGLVGAGIVHIAIVLLIPALSQQDAWSRVAAMGEPYRFLRLDRDQPGSLVAGADPMFEAAVCRFNLDDGPLHVTARGKVPFWSFAVFDRRGRNVYSVTDRTALGAEPDIVVASPAQLLEMRKEMPAELANAIFIESGLSDAMVVIRAFVPDETWRAIVDGFLDGATCATP